MIERSLESNSAINAKSEFLPTMATLLSKVVIIDLHSLVVLVLLNRDKLFIKLKLSSNFEINILLALLFDESLVVPHVINPSFILAIELEL